MGCWSIAGLPPNIKFAGTHLYPWVERGTVRVKCFAQEHNTMSPARAQTQTARSGDERTNHEATAPPTVYCVRLNFHDISKLVYCKVSFVSMCVCMYVCMYGNWPLPIGAFQDQCKQTTINKYSSKHN